MKKILLFLLLAVCAMPVVNAQVRGKAKVAVYVTGKMGNVERKLISSKALSCLVRSDRYVALERTDSFLNAIMKEQDFQLSGEVSDEQVAEIGAKYGARYVAVFDANKTPDDYCLMSARLVDVETGVIIKSVDGERIIDSTADLIGLTNNLSYRLFVQSK
ncbi:MAG: hypothetical protein IJN55_06705 [Alistipes sp.]|nr:hypothetical protein [Alistipes sp.]